MQPDTGIEGLFLAGGMFQKYLDEGIGSFPFLSREGEF
jgi:hypothetical protein